jgi:predicted nucleic acid-binding protein
MLASHAAYDREALRRPRRPPPPRGAASRHHDRRDHADGARDAPRGHGLAPPARRCRGRAQRAERHLGARRGDHPRGVSVIALIVDAGPLYAYVDASDAHHAACLELLETHPGPLVVPTLVVTEVAYLIGTRLGWEPEARFLGDLASGAFTLEPVHPADALRMVELVARYHDLPLGTVDASVIAAAERLDVTEIATVDRGHFSVVRPRHASAFVLLP